MRTVCTTVLALSLLLTSCTIWKKPSHPSWSNATAGEELERLFWEDVKAGRFAELEKQLASTFVFLDKTGPKDRAAAVEHLRALGISDFSLGDVQVQPNGPDLVVTYVVTLKGKTGRPIAPGRLRMMGVWQQVGARWIKVAHAVADADPASGYKFAT